MVDVCLLNSQPQGMQRFDYGCSLDMVQKAALTAYPKARYGKFQQCCYYYCIIAITFASLLLLVWPRDHVRPT